MDPACHRTGRVLIHHAHVPKSDRVDIGAIPVTSPLRTLCDCVTAHVAPELIDAAVKQARGRGLIDKDDAQVIRSGPVPQDSHAPTRTGGGRFGR